MRAYLGLGTNLGSDKVGNLEQAIQLIDEQAGHVLACSSFIESEPWGFNSEHSFVNAVVSIDTLYTPHKLLQITQDIERRMGRTHKTIGMNYTDRIIDIDILLYGEETINSPELTVPHPYIMQREFVFLPLFEIAPEMRDFLKRHSH